MKILPLAVILVTAVIGGRFLGLEWARSAESSRTEARPEQDKDEILAVAEEHAEKLARDHFSAVRAKRAEFDADIEKRRLEALAEGQSRVERMGEIMDRTEKTVEDLEGTLERDLAPGDYLVARATIGLMSDDLAMGRILIGASEESVRRDGVRRLARAAGEGSVEAIELLMTLFSDPNQTIAQEALRQAAGLARKGDDERRQLLADSGLEARLVAMLPGLEGGSQRRVLDALTAQGSPAATQAWRQIYNDDSSRNRDLVSAARALKDLGSPGEYDQILLQLEYDLTSDDQRAMRSALNDIRRLGGDQAKATLKRVLDANPDSEAAEMIRRTIERFDRQDRQTMRLGNDAGPPVPGAFGGRRGRRGDD